MSNNEEAHHIITAKRIEKLTPGRTCWFWLAQYGSDKQVSLYLHPIKRDPLAKTFVAKVQEKRKLFQPKGTEIRGQLQRTDKGTLLLTSPDPITKCVALFNSLSSSSAVLGESLSNIVIVESRDGSPKKLKTWKSNTATERRTSVSVDASKQEAVLNGMTTNNIAFFWLGTPDQSKQVQLLLSAKKQELRSTVKALGEKAVGVSGEVVRTAKGYLVFRAQKPSTSFLRDLAVWYKKNRKKYPGLNALQKSRMICKNADGEIIEQQKNDILW